MARHVRAFRAMRRTIILLFALMLAGRTLCGPSGFEVRVRFISAKGHTRDEFIPLSDEEGRQLQFNPRGARRYVLAARCQYAERLGFGRGIYGDDHWKIVPGLRVENVRLNTPAGGSIDIP